jgi:hypothetical protein
MRAGTLTLDRARYLAGGLSDQADACMQLAQLVVAATAIGEDLDAVQRQVDVRAAAHQAHSAHMVSGALTHA